MIRFEREGEERFARWMGGEEWRATRTLNLLFELGTRPVNEQDETTGVGPAPPRNRGRLWCERVKSMGPDEIDDFERRTFATWDRLVR